jgi:hypothetical protein
MFGTALQNFRSDRQLKPISEVMISVQAGLADRENIRNWQRGIEKFDPVTGDGAFSSYAGFSRSMVSAAAEAASHASFDGDARFAANDLEVVLDPRSVSLHLKGLSPDAPQGTLDQAAAAYISGSMASAIAERKALQSQRKATM